ncbi:MAG: M20/M25/M40 family metallo-hydrolase, partial [Candidatus Latescibacteria bacterium]|nr:M20/M25/M40 family metallo-hydrolase [Candidatus Latescibacterota bacterium]
LSILREREVEARLIPVPGGPPVVYGTIKGRSDQTLLFYNHYDVQPAEPLELWESSPFEPARRDGKLYARGASDNKSDLAARLEAIQALRDVEGELPVSITFVWEGEEESGSRHFPEFVRTHADLLRADVCLSEGTHPDRNGRPVLICGVKGLLYVELEAKAAVIDTHSMYAPVVPSGVWKLVRALSTLKDRSERVLIDGFYEDVRPLSQADLEAIRSMPDEDEALRETFGLPAFLDGLRGDAWRERLYSAPTCNICGILTGYTGPGPKTVLPAAARAKIDFRLVPDQDPADILAKLRRHLERHGFGDLSLTVLGEEPPQRTPLTHPSVRLVADTAQEFYDAAPILVPTAAGTAPMAAIADIGVPVFFPPGGAGYQGSQIHAPNEHIRMADLAEAIKITARLMQRIGGR